jgi:hypothetical protein
MPPRYKFVEVSPVTDETLEAAVNEWVGKGWELEGIRFVVPEHAKRPHLAFVSFVAAAAAAASAEQAQVGQAGQAEAPSVPRPLPAPDEQASAASVITAPNGADVD